MGIRPLGKLFLLCSRFEFLVPLHIAHCDNSRDKKKGQLTSVQTHELLTVTVL